MFGIAGNAVSEPTPSSQNAVSEPTPSSQNAVSEPTPSSQNAPPRSLGTRKERTTSFKENSNGVCSTALAIVKDFDPVVAEHLHRFAPEARELVKSFITSATDDATGKAGERRKLSLLYELVDASAASEPHEFVKALVASITGRARTVNYVKAVLASLRQRRSEAAKEPPVAATKDRPKESYIIDRQGRVHKLCGAEDVVVDDDDIPENYRAEAATARSKALKEVVNVLPTRGSIVTAVAQKLALPPRKGERMRMSP
jgi:hypothetical protein